ncbi:apoptosis-inducing factor, putative [Cordyceps militaris CM01]|uniref:Apoptosis-inducing factor, putative n=1 Tax=Cordyceps militaris (strain CM01) TaxID=983644 RepID=G3JDM6_CORMM|nr:apoptosis-inducing factor, putative [Cordyceps militaris CM01]EGX92701.1 apoptosis-inducing factor, putative [Cordyceps militaris CM01]
MTGTGKTVVVLGGSIGGLGVAHRLLKKTLPKHPDLKVILVSKNSHFYWNVAAVRAIIPDAVQDEELLQPIGPGLAQYNTSAHPAAAEFVLGAAQSVDTTARTVTIETADDADGSPRRRTVRYDYLVLATGSRSVAPGLPWKADGTYADLIAELHGTAARVRAAAHIVVAGGGATGVEVCGELRHECPDTRVVLVAGSGEALLGGDATAPALERALTDMGVVVRKGVRTVGTRDTADGRTEVALSNGETIVTDLYLQTVGMAPNSEFIPDELLDDKKLVKADEYMRVTGADNVWAVGDIVGKPSAGYLITEAQASCVATNIGSVLSGKEQQPRGSTMDIILVSTGRCGGVGRYGWLPIPSFAVWVAKSRTLGVERTPKFVDGSIW